MNNRQLLSTAIAMCITAALSASQLAQKAWAGESKVLSIVVMDPLAAPLSCPCVEGYAQRDYEALAKLFERELGLKVNLTFASSLDVGVKKAGGADIVIGKQSVVSADLKDLKLDAQPAYRLTDNQGSVTQHGLIVVNQDDPAKTASDLAGYTIIFGSASAAEKHEAALDLLKKANVAVPKKLRKIDEACSDGACKVIDLGPKSKTAAVISSYAQPLLEGCGTIKKGDLRVVARTKDVPFVTMFLSDKLSGEKRSAIDAALKTIPLEPSVLEALESVAGFVEVAQDESRSVKKKGPQTARKAG